MKNFLNILHEAIPYMLVTIGVVMILHGMYILLTSK